MKETRETAPKKEKKKRRFSWRWMTVAAVCVYSVVTIISQQNILAARRQEQEDLLAREKELQNEIEFMNNDEKYIGSETFVERAAREKLGWVKDGEIVFKKKNMDAGTGSAQQGTDADSAANNGDAGNAATPAPDASSTPVPDNPAASASASSAPAAASLSPEA